MPEKKDDSAELAAAPTIPDVAESVPASSSETLNLNDYVWIRFRDKGRALLREDDAKWLARFQDWHGQLASAEKQEAENDGWSKWQLWSLIRTFGDAIYLGCDPPFETTIRLAPPLAGNPATTEVSSPPAASSALKEHSHSEIPDMAGTEPRLTDELLLLGQLRQTCDAEPSGAPCEVCGQASIMHAFNRLLGEKYAEIAKLKRRLAEMHSALLGSGTD